MLLYSDQKYRKVIPYRMIKFSDYYLMNPSDDKDIWYRGRKENKWKYEFDTYSESLEKILESL